MPRVKVGMSCGKGDEEGERGQTRQTHYSSWKDPSINKDFTPGHFFKKRSLICKEQEKHFHNYNERCRYKFDFDARDWEAAASKQGSNSEEASELIDSRWWGRRRFLTPRWQSPPPYAGSQRTWCTGTEAGRKEGRKTRLSARLPEHPIRRNCSSDLLHTWQVCCRRPKEVQRGIWGEFGHFQY